MFEDDVAVHGGDGNCDGDDDGDDNDDGDSYDDDCGYGDDVVVSGDDCRDDGLMTVIMMVIPSKAKYKSTNKKMSQKINKLGTNSVRS